jgi:hypothetical protein
VTDRASAAAHTQRALVLMHDSMADPQAQAGALGVLGGEEGLEDLRHVFRRDAAAIVRHGNSYAFAPLPVMSVFYADKNISRRRYGFNRVLYQIGKDLPQFAGKGRQRPNRAEVLMYSDLASFDAPVIGRQHLFKQVRH